MKQKITCPVLGCIAELTFDESPETSRILAATRCSLIEGEVDCEQECIRRMNIRRDEERKDPRAGG